QVHRPGEILCLNGSDKGRNFYTLVLNLTCVYIAAGISRRGTRIHGNDLVVGIGFVPSHIKTEQAVKEVQFDACFNTFLPFRKQVAVVSGAWQRKYWNGTKTSLRVVNIINT